MPKQHGQRKASTQLWLQLAYTGSRFHGAAHSAGVHTVESAVRKRLAQAFADAPLRAFSWASRTDAGVDAADNACSVRIALADPRCLQSGLVALQQDRDDGLRICRAAALPFLVLARCEAAIKTYHYTFAPQPWPHLLQAQQAASALVGTHCFVRFAHPQLAKDTRAQTPRPLLMAQLTQTQGSLLFVCRGPAFLRQQVRRMAGALAAVGAAALPAEALVAALRGAPFWPPMPLASAAGLCLQQQSLSPRLQQALVA